MDFDCDKLKYVPRMGLIVTNKTPLRNVNQITCMREGIVLHGDGNEPGLC